MGATNYSVEVEGLGKAYRMYSRPLDRFLEWGSFGRLQRHGQFWALRDVDFKLRPGPRRPRDACGSTGGRRACSSSAPASTWISPDAPTCS
ncbi:MAG: hypothetical protein ACYSWX_11365 [Planctomycetota bacterium]|jgi:hypothetical protein